jgi:protein-disulfide isomerase
MRRRILLGLAGLTGLAALVFVAARAPVRGEDAPAAAVSVDELMKPGELPDLTLGPADARVTIIEYASMSCPHCMHFDTQVFPDLKAKYIDTNKVRFIFREFPLDRRAVAAAMIARCAGPDKALSLIDTLFQRQAEWAFTPGNPAPRLIQIAAGAGLTEEAADKCLKDDQLVSRLRDAQERASEKFGVNATPTFFINGKRLTVAPTIDEFAKAIDPLLSQG